MDTGTEAAMTSFGEEACGDSGATGVEAGAVMVLSAPTACVEVLDAQPVSSSKATAADATWHLRRALVELII